MKSRYVRTMPQFCSPLISPSDQLVFHPNSRLRRASEGGDEKDEVVTKNRYYN